MENDEKVQYTKTTHLNRRVDHKYDARQCWKRCARGGHGGRKLLMAIQKFHAAGNKPPSTNKNKFSQKMMNFEEKGHNEKLPEVTVDSLPFYNLVVPLICVINALSDGHFSKTDAPFRKHFY